MKIFYFCRTGHHTSLIASALHLGILSGKPLNSRQLYSIPGYDRFEFRDIGKPYYTGTDYNGNEVYTIGAWRESEIMQRTLHDIIRIMGVRPGEWEVVDTSPYISGWTIAGLKMKRIRLHGLARAFFFLGARQEVGRMAKTLTVGSQNATCH